MASAPVKNEKHPDEATGGKKLVVRLLADYWDADGVRHSASYIDENGERREDGALIELPEAEARKLVKTPAAERGDEY
jgi:hypothetical protein